MANKAQIMNDARKLAESPRMTVEYLMETYTKEELMRIFRYHMINEQQVLTQAEVDMILALDEEDPLIKRHEMKKPTTNGINSIL